MAGVNLAAIHNALASQIQARLLANGRDTSCFPFPPAAVNVPCISVYPGEIEYFSTFGASGNADYTCRIKLEVDANDVESVYIKLCDYLSVGTGNGSSIVDAIMSDRTLGGVVGSVAALTAEFGDADSERGVAWLPVQIILTKQNAQV